MKKIFTLINCLLIVSCYSQNLVSYYKIKTRGKPYSLNLAKAQDGNFFVAGAYDYLNGKLTNALTKVDQTGNAINSFQAVSVDQGFIESVSELPNGKILIQGTFTKINGTDRVNLARLHSDGSLDQSFVSEFSNIYGFDIQSDGRIIITGVFNGHKGYQNMARLNTDGSADEGFDKTIPHIIGSGRMVIDQSDRIFYATNDNIYRRTSNGAHDVSFLTGAGAEGTGQIWRLKALSGNRVLVSGNFTKFNTLTAKSLVVIDQNGTVDASFNLNMGDGPNGQVNSLLIRSNGNLIVAGTYTSFNSQPAGMVELKPDGTLFKVIATVYGGATNVIELADNKIAVCGEFTVINGVPKQYLALFNTNYTQVGNFTADITYTNTNARFLIVNSVGELFLGGQMLDYDGFFDGTNLVETPLARFSPLAKYDPEFQPQFDNNTSIYSIAMQANNKMVASGFLNSTTNTRLARIGIDGLFDPTFQIGSGLTQNGFPGYSYRTKFKNSTIYLVGGFDHYNNVTSHGLVALNLDGSVNQAYTSFPILSSVVESDLQSDGKVILLGEFPFPSGNKRLIRLNTDGSLDLTFQSADGLGLFNFVHVDSQDRIYLGGYLVSYDGALVNDLIRLLPNGSIDGSFNTGSGFGGDRGANSMEFLPDDHIAIGGDFYSYNGEGANGLVIIDNDGNIVPTPQLNFVADSRILQMKYHNDALYIGGRVKLASNGEVFGVGKVSFSNEPIPNAPSDLSVSIVSPGNFQINWTNNSSNEVAYILERSIEENSGYVQIELLDSNTISNNDTDIEINITYYYRIKAVNDGGDSNYSNIASEIWVVPSQPTNLFASQSLLNEINLSWTDNSSNEDGFVIERSVGDDSHFVLINQTSAEVTEFKNLVLPNTEYFYRIAAYSAGGNSAFSNTVNLRSIYLPVGPSNLTVAQLDVDKITLNWNDNSDNEDGFVVERSVGASTNFIIIANLNADEAMFKDDNIAQQTDYLYRVYAINLAGKSVYANVATIKSLYPPIAPDQLMARQTKLGEVTLTWRDNSENEASFKIEKSIDGTNFIESGQSNANAQTFKDSVGPPDAFYAYRIKSHNLVGESAYSETAQLDVILGADDLTYEPVIFPNPTSEFINISNQSTSTDRAEWNLINVLGQQQSIQSVISPEYETIDVKHLPNGMYFLIKSNTNSKPIKVLISK